MHHTSSPASPAYCSEHHATAAAAAASQHHAGWAHAHSHIPAEADARGHPRLIDP